MKNEHKKSRDYLNMAIPLWKLAKPKHPKAGMWEYDDKAENVCQKTGYKRKAFMACKDYDCKV